MRLTVLLAIGLTALLTACHDDDDSPATPWEIGQSDPATARAATGAIDRQNSGPKKTYTVKEAFLVQGDKDTHILRYKFAGSPTDSLDLVIIKRTRDYNYHAVTQNNQNLLAYAIFNTDTLTMTESAVSIQPRTNENRFSTVVNVHTLDFGDLNGTVEHVPYITRK